VGETTPKAQIDAIARSLGLTGVEFALRKAYLQLGEQDVQLLRSIAEPLRAIHPKIMDAFYAHLQGFSQTRDYLQDPQVIQQLRHKQEQYFSELLSGQYDEAYLHNRLRVGIVHQQIGLSSDWYVGAYANFLTALLPELIHLVGDDSGKLLTSIAALIKVVFLDLNVVLETYAYADKYSIQLLKDYAESLVCNIPLGLIVVSQDLTIVSANQYMDEKFGITHASMKGTPLTRYFPGSGLHTRAIEVLTSKHPQFGVHLSLDSGKQAFSHCEISITPITLAGYQTGGPDQPALLIVLEDTTERDTLIETTRAYDNRVRAILDNVAEGIITIDEDGRIESFNPAAEKLFGYHASEVIGQNVKRLMPSPYQDNHDHYLRNYATTRERRCLGQGFREVEGQRKDGSTFPLDLSISELSLPEKQLYIGIVRDITQRKLDEAEMAKLSLAIEQTADAIMITDKNGVIEYVNGGFENTTGYQRKKVIGKRPSILKSGVQDAGFYRNLWQQVEDGQVFQDIFINRKKNGDLYYEEKTITPLRDRNGNITHFISTGKDITERMRTQKRLQFLAHHDVLTTLPNRLLFMDRIAHAIAHAKRNGSKLALLFLDLDRFKKINDTLGHNVGDMLLKQLSARLKHGLRQDDTVARLSGDEFAVLLSDIQQVDDIPPITNKILQQFNEPFLIEGHELFITTSIGIAIFPNDGTNPDTLLKHADTAMYAAKATGRGTFSFYTPDMNAMASMHLQMENDLRHALQREQFVLVYQPQFSISQPDTILGAEVLIRWRHPTHGLLRPAKFIPLLEDTGIINQVGEWILRSACAQLRTWLHLTDQLPRLAINIAPHQLTAPDFVEMVLTILADYALPPSCLELEITESSLMQDEARAVEVLTKLHAAGVNIAMDDFGTGYSSLSYLRRLPVNTLKIDRSFIRQIPHAISDCELTRAIIAMGRSLNLRVVAEGVETNEQLAYLRELGCDGVQGFLLGRPMPAADFHHGLQNLNLFKR
jgi:diguanylate cyclase (GGDEF)-like protein/PAS domain S-box-containing protein